jgi:hypothetical protein
MKTKSSINTVEASGILTIDLLDFKPDTESAFLDLKDFLYQGLIIKEKEFKEAIANTDWQTYLDKPVAIGCSQDTIIPPWVYMFISGYLQGIASTIDHGSAEQLDLKRWQANIARQDFGHYEHKKVVIRAHPAIDPLLYITATQKLKPIVKTLMYGEAGLPKVIWKN